MCRFRNCGNTTRERRIGQDVLIKSLIEKQLPVQHSGAIPVHVAALAAQYALHAERRLQTGEFNSLVVDVIGPAHRRQVIPAIAVHRNRYLPGRSTPPAVKPCTGGIKLVGPGNSRVSDDRRILSPRVAANQRHQQRGERQRDNAKGQHTGRQGWKSGCADQSKSICRIGQNGFADFSDIGPARGRCETRPRRLADPG